MKYFRPLSIALLFIFDCIPQHAQSSVSLVASSESQDVIPAFSSAGSITLSAMRRLIDINYPGGKKERGELLVVYDQQGGHHLWRYRPVSSPNDSEGAAEAYKSQFSGIYVTADSLVEFAASGVIEHKAKSSSLGNAENASIDEIQRTFPQGRYVKDLKIVPFLDAPPLVGFEKSPLWTKRLPGFTPVSTEFLCDARSRVVQGRCPYPTLVVSISKLGDNWRLVLRNRWDVELILDSNFNAVSSKQLTVPAKQ
jgi:hypothetical protein